MAGTAYLAELLDRYGAPGAFAAYNASQHATNGISPVNRCRPRRKRMSPISRPW
ncbi:hypothetical protein [Bradyrhizobium sp. CCGUVB23]|uniref:hypothetical protein n=1 Tax=Bradyrhizobium sp. CCGUVB23 TaxID=2949630 RepID=UPI00353277E2